jgi:hypothetical protein
MKAMDLGRPPAVGGTHPVNNRPTHLLDQLLKATSVAPRDPRVRAQRVEGPNTSLSQGRATLVKRRGGLGAARLTINKGLELRREVDLTVLGLVKTD